jgi:hypothetical protein
LKKSVRIAILVLASAFTTVVGVGTGSPANAADVIAIANYKSGDQRCAEPVNGYNGADVVLRTCNGSAAQAWARIGVGGGYYYMINQGYPNMCMDVRDGRDRDGTLIQIWSCTNTDGMKWSFSSAGYPYDKIKSKLGRCLDTYAAQSNEGAWLATYRCVSYRTSQYWAILQ